MVLVNNYKNGVLIQGSLKRMLVGRAKTFGCDVVLPLLERFKGMWEDIEFGWVNNSIQPMVNDKSPRLDEFLCEFYKATWDFVGPTLFQV